MPLSPHFSPHASLAARRTKEFWIGGAPPPVSIDNNLSYLAATTLLPNYDTGKVVSGAALASAYGSWQSAARAAVR